MIHPAKMGAQRVGNEACLVTQKSGLGIFIDFLQPDDIGIERFEVEDDDIQTMLGIAPGLHPHDVIGEDLKLTLRKDRRSQNHEYEYALRHFVFLLDLLGRFLYTALLGNEPVSRSANFLSYFQAAAFLCLPLRFNLKIGVVVHEHFQMATGSRASP